MIYSPLQVAIFILVSLLQALQVIQFVHEIAHLVLQRCNLSVALGKLLLFALQIECLLVNQSVKLLDLIEGLGDFKFEVANVAAEVITLVCLNLVRDIKSVDLFKVFPVALSEGSQLVIRLSLL